MRISGLNFGRESCPSLLSGGNTSTILLYRGCTMIWERMYKLLGMTRGNRGSPGWKIGTQRTILSLGELRTVGVGKVSLQGMGRVIYYKYSVFKWQNSHSFRTSNICVLPASLTGWAWGIVLLPRFPFPSGRIKMLSLQPPTQHLQLSI